MSPAINFLLSSIILVDRVLSRRPDGINLLTEIMDVFLMVRRKKTTMFIDAKESTTVVELKKMIRGIMKRTVEDMKLFKEGTVIEDQKTLGDVGFTSSTARAQAPATIGLAFRQEDGAFEPLEITDLSTPPDLPEVMKPQESVSSHPQD